MSLSEDLGQRVSHAATQEIRSALAHQRLSLAALSLSSGLPRSTLHRKLGGASELTVGQLVQLAVALDIPAADLLTKAAEAAGALELSPGRPAGRLLAPRRPRRP